LGWVAFIKRLGCVFILKRFQGKACAKRVKTLAVNGRAVCKGYWLKAGKRLISSSIFEIFFGREKFVAGEKMRGSDCLEGLRIV